MYETFEKLPENKKEQILQVCMEEFVENGYGNASTNTIVKRLGISKGLLFLYFKSKKSLYLFLVEHYFKILLEDYLRTYDNGLNASIDIFDNLGEFYKDLLQKKPDLILFMLQAFLHTPTELREEVEERHNLIHGDVIRHLSTTGFREGIDVRIVVDLLHLVSFSIGQAIFADLKGKAISTAEKEIIDRKIESYEGLFAKYIDILKFGVYEK